MTSGSATQVVMLTPEGRGAVASLLVEGRLATEIVGGLFRPAGGRPLGEQPCEKIVFGRWQATEAGEELVVCRRDEQHVEVHCHGGHAAVAAIIATLLEHGCQEVAWRLWVRRSTADPIAAAARIALAVAPTERVAAILWDQYSGALRRALDEVAAQIAAGDAQAALNRVEALVAWSALGCHLVEPSKVVLAGRPNVGKSSLINALLGYERAIVHHLPGTTRDLVTGSAAIEGWPVELADTAGLHASTDPLEAAGIRLARNRLAAADLVVLVFDASQPWSDEDKALAIAWPTALQVHNKCDLIGPGACARAAELYVSAKTGQGLDAFQREIARRLVPQPPAQGQAMPFTPQHVKALSQIHAALSANQMAAADQLLADSRRWASEAC